MNERINSVFEKTEKYILDCDPATIQSESLLTGKLGLALYSIYKSKEKSGDHYLNKLTQVLESVFDNISQQKSFLATQTNIIEGLPGLGYVLYQAMRYELLDPEYEEQVNVINTLAYEKALKKLPENSFDYFYGTIGLLFYLNETGSTGYCNDIIDILYEHALKTDYYFYNNTNDSYTEGVNFGFAHGSAAIISIMITLYEKNINPHKTKNIALNTLERLLKFRRGEIDVSKITLIDTRENIFPSVFPYNIVSSNNNLLIKPETYNNENLYHYSGRLGWCNSDLGIIYLLYKASHVFSEQKYHALAEELGMDVVKRRSFYETDIRDYYMCHGTSGVAMLYNKIFNLTGNNIYYREYEYWVEATVHRMEKEIEGKISYHKLQLLTGWLGPLLLLYSYNGSKELEGWDKIFLV